MIGVILGGFAAAVAIVRMSLPAIAHHLHERVVLVWAMGAATLLFSIYPLTSSPIEMCACSVLLGLALGMEQPMVMSMLHQMTPAPLQGDAIGLRLLLNNGSSALAPVLLGAASGLAGLAAAVWLFSGLLGFGSRAAWRLGRSVGSTK